MRKLLLLPLPPPYAGPETIAEGIPEALGGRKAEDLEVVNTTLRKKNREKGRFNLRGLLAFLPVYFRFVCRLLRSDVVFMYFCSSRVGFLRDSAFILTSRMFGRRVVAQYHGGGFRRFFLRQARVFRWFIAFALKRAETVLVLGESLRPMMRGIVPRESVSVLYNGVRLNDFPPAPKKVQGVFTVFFMGHLTFPKGFYDLVKAYSMLHRRYGPRIAMIFAGERVGYKEELSRFLDDSWADFYLRNISEITSLIESFIDESPGVNA